MSATRADDIAPPTLGALLERDRLQRRAVQLERVVARLRERARADDACVAERTGLHRAVADFAADLDQIRKRLNEAPRAVVEHGDADTKEDDQ